MNVVPNSPELHLAPLNFAPNTSAGLIGGPNPRLISNAIAGGTGAAGQTAATPDPIAGAWVYVFGQFVDHDLSLEYSPLNGQAINISVPPGDPMFTSGTSIAMTRDVRSPTTNTIMNTAAGYLDLSQVYGSSASVANTLRNADGTLNSSGNGQYLPVVNGYFVTGDPRVMENPELVAVTTLWLREHNSWVRQLKTQHASWTGDQLFNMARAITTAEYQNIVYEEYLPVLIGPVLDKKYRGYSSEVNAQVTQEFSTAAFRVGHSQVSDTQDGIDVNGKVVFSQPLAEAFFNSPEKDIHPNPDVPDGINALLRGVSKDSSQATDVYTVAALRNLLFAPLVGGTVDQVDLIAIDIQRERDAGLGSLNQTRKALEMSPYTSFAQLTPDTVLQKSFASIYGTIDNVDLFMGGLAETHARGAIVGPTFQKLIAAQFESLRRGDRFFWMNQNFDEETSRMISATTLAKIIKRNTDTTTLQDNVFLTQAAQRQERAVSSTPIVTHGQAFIRP